MSKSLIGLMLPSFVVFGGATAGVWNVSEAPALETPQPLGAPRRAVAESRVARDADSPAALVDGVLAAIARGDRAWLARSLSSCSSADPLTEAELSIAWLRFEWSEAKAVWERIAEARARGDHAFDVGAERATMTFGEGLTLAFVKSGGSWCVADS